MNSLSWFLGAYKETLSGVWHSGAPTTPALLATQGVLKQPQFAKVLVGEPTPMVATGLLLPQLRAQVLEKLTLGTVVQARCQCNLLQVAKC